MGLLLLAAAGAAGVRAWRCSITFFFSDEAFSWRVAEGPSSELLQRVGGDTHPPGHFVVEKLWMSVWGDSPASLRGLSALCGVAAVLVMYWLCREALGGRLAAGLSQGGALLGEPAVAPGRPALAKPVAHDDLAAGVIPGGALLDKPAVAHDQPALAEPVAHNALLEGRAVAHGALFAAALVAVHLAQIMPSRTARMYSMGVLLTGFSSWLLLRALAAQRRRTAWWAIYGVSAAAFALTHNFAIFSLAAQGAFALGDAVRQVRHESWARARGTLAGLAVAVGVCVALYSPWIPVFLAQAARVRESFWIRDLDWYEAARAFVAWTIGFEHGAPADAWPLLAIVAVVVIWMLVRVDRAGMFFLLQAGVPWLMTVVISLFGGRPILQDRYLAFSQFALLGLFGVACARLPGKVERAALACALTVPCLAATCDYLYNLPTQPPPIAAAGELLKSQYRPGDVVIVSGYAENNELRYYAAQAGLRTIDVRCPVGAIQGTGHINHLSSLSSGDVLWETADPPAEVRRLWLTGKWPAYGDPDWKKVLARTFPSRHPAQPEYTLTLLARRSP